MKLLRKLGFAIFQHDSTITGKNRTLEIKRYRTILGISNLDHIGNDLGWDTIKKETGSFENLIIIVKKKT